MYLRVILCNAAANFCFSTKEARRFAYRLAVAYHKKCAPSWIDQEIAGQSYFLFIIDPAYCIKLLKPSFPGN